MVEKNSYFQSRFSTARPSTTDELGYIYEQLDRDQLRQASIVPDATKGDLLQRWQGLSREGQAQWLTELEAALTRSLE